MMVEMQPLLAKFDAFVTAGLGEAPRLADYRSVSFWQKPSPLTAWNVTGQPVLALPNGFGRNGLPLGMQILGRPFGEETICASATPTSRRPNGTRGAPRSCPGRTRRPSRRRPSCRAPPIRSKRPRGTCA